MGWLLDTLKEIPLSAVLKEKIAAIEDKYAAAETQSKILEGDLRKANERIAQLKEQNQRLEQQVEKLKHTDDLDEIELELLNRIAHTDHENATAQIIHQAFPDLSLPRVEYHFHRLNEFGYIAGGTFGDFGEEFSVTQKGRTLLLKKGLL